MGSNNDIQKLADTGEGELDHDTGSNICSHHRNGLEEEDGLDYNILHVSKARDLSLRHTNSLKVKKGKSIISLQVKTRSRKGRLLVVINDR